VPDNFTALKKTVEALIKEDKEDVNNQSIVSMKDYTIKYIDKDDEHINVSDDEDLLTAYEVAESDLNGTLKFIIEKKP
jgi:hypothetical protein